MTAMNNSPIFCINHIVSRLFNNHLLCDVEFVLGDQMLHSHSILLMCRSIVFAEKLKHLHGTHKLFTITDFQYSSFYEFLRFIYQDDCTITEETLLELLQLAIMYKVPKLENLLISHIIVNYGLIELERKIKLFEFCLTENYELLRDWMNDNMATEYLKVIQSPYFLKLKPETVEHILRFNFVSEFLREIDIFNATLKWMNKYCEDNGLDLSVRRTKFTNIIHLIRFPVMSVDEFSKVIKANRDLFSITEYSAFFDGSTLEAWDSNMRTIMKSKDKLSITVNFPNGLVRYIKSKVDLIFVGLWLGSIYDINGKPINMSVVISPYQSTFESPIAFRLVSNVRDYIISLGETLLLKGNHSYSIRIHFLDQYNHRSIDVDRFSPLLKQKLNPEIADSIEVNDRGNLGNIFKLYFKVPKKVPPIRESDKFN